MARGSVIVIGGGIAGLATGIYAAANGYETSVLEMHTIPGGLCTSWERQGYCFDGCIHWFVGGKPGRGFYPLWEEVGATEGLELVARDRLNSVRDEVGNELVLWSDLSRVESEMLASWPSDAKAIRGLVKGSHLMAGVGSMVPTTPPDMMRAWDGLKMLVTSGSALRKMRRYQMLTVQDLADGFSDPFLRRAVANAVNEPRISSMALLSTLGWFDVGDANWVMGGSALFARRLERRLLDLGGEIRYRSRVKRILVEDDRAVGVRLSDGTEQRAEVVISAADGHATIFDMLEGRYVDDRIRDLYDNLELFPAIVQVSLGVNRDMSNEPWSVVTLLDDPVEIAGRQVSSAWTHHYSFDPSMAPTGKSSVTCILEGDLEHWQKLGDTSREAYLAEKDAVARQVIDIVERAYPGVHDAVEVVDVATPTTYVRYTGNWRASFEGWLLSPKNTKLTGMAGMPRKLPGLDRFWMAGQWVWPGGGLPSGVLTGRWAIQNLCAADGREFVAPA